MARATIAVQLFQGEQDGWHEDHYHPANGRRPDVIFIWPAIQDTRINSAKGAEQARLVEEYSRLAYKFLDVLKRPEKPGGMVYRYIRHADADKKAPVV